MKPSIVCLLVFSIFHFCDGRKSRMVCEHLDDIFGNDSSEAPPTFIQGIPGKKGPPGQKGDQGPQGPPGAFDRSAIERLKEDVTALQTSTQNELAELKKRLNGIEGDYIPRNLLEICDFFYKGKCYFLVMKCSRINREEVRTACRAKGADLANIYDEEHFEKVRALMRSRICIGSPYNHIWTGMTVDTQLKKIRLSDGTLAPYERWYPGRPFASTRGFAGIHTDSDPNTSGHGMFDAWISGRFLGGICER